MYDNFPRALKYYKTLRDKTNKDISQALDIPEPSISTWNTGKHLPDMDRLHRLADYLEAPIEQFFNFTALTPPNVDKELEALYELVKGDLELRSFLVTYSQLSDEDKALIMQMASKILK